MAEDRVDEAGHPPPAGEEPADADARALSILDAVLGMAAEVVLDLDVTWNQARERFGKVLFERAEERYGTAPKVAAALGTSLRTVKQYRHRRRAEAGAPPEPMFNLRRRVLHLLDDGPKRIADLERVLPTGSDTNRVRSAVGSLEQEGLLVHDRATDTVRRVQSSFVPWYRRPELHPGAQMDALCRGFARLLGTRLTPQAERGAIPALLMAVMHHMPSSMVRAYQEDFVRMVEQFDATWTRRLADLGIDAGAPVSEGDEPDRVRAGATLAVGEMGPPLDEDTLDRLRRRDPRIIAFGDQAPPSYLQYFRVEASLAGGRDPT